MYVFCFISQLGGLHGLKGCGKDPTIRNGESDPAWETRQKAPDGFILQIKSVYLSEYVVLVSENAVI